MRSLQRAMVKTYGLLTKCEVKMARYWPSSFLLASSKRSVSEGTAENSARKNKKSATSSHWAFVLFFQALFSALRPD